MGTSSLQQNVDILALKRLKILSERGEEINFTSLWAKAPVIVVFLRHFSCIGCRAHVDQVWNKQEELRKNKSRIVFIGNGGPQMIQFFKDDTKVFGAEIYTDPALKTFDACGMKRSFKNWASLDTAKNFVKLKMQGYSQGPMDSDSGNHFQMGGVVAFKHPGLVLYHFVSESLGDNDEVKNWPEKSAEEQSGATG